jgi:hypothetical protein
MRELVLVFGALAAIVWLSPSPGIASPEYSRRTGKECAYCHPPTNYTLTDAGKFYQSHKTLKGYEPKTEPRKPKTESNKNP